MKSKKPSKKRTDWKLAAQYWEGSVQRKLEHITWQDGEILKWRTRAESAERERDELRAELEKWKVGNEQLNAAWDIVLKQRHFQTAMSVAKPSLRQRLHNWFKRRSQAKRTVFTEAR